MLYVHLFDCFLHEERTSGCQFRELWWLFNSSYFDCLSKLYLVHSNDLWTLVRILLASSSLSSTRTKIPLSEKSSTDEEYRFAWLCSAASVPMAIQISNISSVTDCNASAYDPEQDQINSASEEQSVKDLDDVETDWNSSIQSRSSFDEESRAYFCIQSKCQSRSIRLSVTVGQRDRTCSIIWRSLDTSYISVTDCSCWFTSIGRCP